MLAKIGSIGAFVILGGVAFYVAVTSGEPRHPGFGLHVEPEALELGEVWAQDNLQWTVPVQNKASRRVEIVELRTSCGCSDVEPLPLTLDGRATGELHLTLDLNYSGAVSASSHQRPVSIKLAPIMKGGVPGETIWELTGKVRRPFSFDSPTLDMGDIVIGAEPYARVFEARCHVPIKSVAVDCDSPDVKVSVDAIAADGSSFELIVTPSVSLDMPQRLSFPVRVQVVTTEGKQLPPFELPVSGRIVTDLAATPEMVKFGLLELGETATETVALRSRTGRPLEIISASADSPDVELELRKSPSVPGAYLLDIDYSPTRGGNYSTTIRILATYDGDDQSPFESTINVSCYVLAQ